MIDWYNSNGLEDGKIPANTECPFWDRCDMRNDNCPSNENNNIRPHPFSCACARGWSLIISGKDARKKDENE